MLFYRQLSSLAGSALLSQAVYLLCTPLVANLYQPVEFGSYGKVTAIASLIAVAASLKYELLLPILDEEASGIFQSFLLILAITLSTVITLIYCFFQNDLSEVIPVLFLSVLLSVTQILVFGAMRSEMFSQIAIARFFMYGGIPVFQLLSSSFSHGLLVGDVLSKFVAIFYLFKSQSTKLILSHWSRFTSIFVLNWRYPVYMMTAALLNSAVLQIPVIIISSKFGLKEAGLFLLSRLVVQAPGFIIAQPLGQIFYTSVSKNIRNNVFDKRIVVRFIMLSVALASAASALLYFAIPVLEDVALPKNWSGVSDIVRAMTLFTFGQVAAVPISQTLNLFNKSHYQLIWDVARTTFMLGLLSVSQLDFIATLTQFSIFGFIFYISLLFISYQAFQNGNKNDNQG